MMREEGRGERVTRRRRDLCVLALSLSPSLPLLWGCGQQRGDPVAQVTQAADSADQLMVGVRLYLTNQGVRQAYVEADTAFVYENTGRTELKPGAEGASSVSGEEAGRAAFGAVATQVFRDVVADKLPFDVSFEASTVRAGRYVTDKIYVGYTRRLDAQTVGTGKAQNEDEVRIEYQITPRWTFESRYGEVQSNVSLVWSRDY